MDAVSREFEEHLAALRRRCDGKPREEIRHLLLLALEREQMVSISYSGGADPRASRPC